MWKQVSPKRSEISKFGNSMSNIDQCIGSGMPYSGDPILSDGSLWARCELDKAKALNLWNSAGYEQNIEDVHNIESNLDRLALFLRAFKLKRRLSRVWCGVMTIQIGDNQSVVGWFRAEEIAEIVNKVRLALTGSGGWAPDIKSALRGGS